jgi:chemotaxis protein methyltransferase CheR
VTGAGAAAVELSVADFNRIREHLRRETGVRFEDKKRTLFRSRLAKRLRILGITSYAEYADFLIKHDPEQTELGIALNLVTTNLTSFFREAHHFEYLAETLIPEILATPGRERTIRIWSCACSTGAEPYTLAIVLREALKDHPDWDIKILASDINTEVLAYAERGIYSAEEVRGVPEPLLRRHYQRGNGQRAGHYRIHPETRRLVTFRQVNLLRPWPDFHSPFDGIFCRNVLIYFSAEDQERVITEFAAKLRLGGALFLGHSESVPAGHALFERLPKTVFRRKAPENSAASR